MAEAARRSALEFPFILSLPSAGYSHFTLTGLVGDALARDRAGQRADARRGKADRGGNRDAGGNECSIATIHCW